jgi:HIRAN domain
MGFMDYFRAKPGHAPDPPLRLGFEEREWDSESESSGEELDGYGYGLRDEDDRAIAWDDQLLAANGIEVMKVAGTSHRLADIQSPAFAPGSPLLLKPDPKNRFDKNAIGVWDARGRIKAGFVPKERAAEIGRRLRSERLEALLLWEWRDSRGERCGLRMLVAPPEVLVERPRALTSPPTRA